MHFYLFFGLITAVLVFFIFLSRRNARAAARNIPLAPDEVELIKAKVPITRKLPQNLWPLYERKIQRFRQQITFYGGEEMDVSHEMALTIAAQACLLVVNTSAWYHRLKTVIVYPGAFKSRVREFDGAVMHEYDCVRLGESWLGGPVVLSWQHSADGALDPRDGHNLVLHEFAHQLDDLSGDTDAVPFLSDGQSYQTWREVWQAAFERHVDHVRSGKTTVLDAYGAENPVEHFAVAVEAFFERPHAVKREEPEVYDQLSEFFQLDPAAWT
ncbi:MAG: M90 family metallopeptidase [Pseudomonadota bacterium]